MTENNTENDKRDTNNFSEEENKNNPSSDVYENNNDKTKENSKSEELQNNKDDVKSDSKSEGLDSQVKESNNQKENNSDKNATDLNRTENSGNKKNKKIKRPHERKIDKEKYLIEDDGEDDTLVFPECIVPRAAWGALAPTKEIESMEHPVSNVIFTYKTGVPRCETDEECVRSLKELQCKHLGSGMSDIAFNFMIGGNNKVYEGRGWKLQPDSSFQYPELQGKKLEVGIIGDYDTSKWEVPFAMAGIGLDLAHYGVEQGFLLKKYRLIETQKFIQPDVYIPNKGIKYPKYHLFFEEYNWATIGEKEDPNDPHNIHFDY